MAKVKVTIETDQPIKVSVTKEDGAAIDKLLKDIEKAEDEDDGDK
jgi:hypothetical protein